MKHTRIKATIVLLLTLTLVIPVRTGLALENCSEELLRDLGVSFVACNEQSNQCSENQTSLAYNGGAEGVKDIVGGVSNDGNPNHILSYPVGLDEELAANAINIFIQEKNPDSPFVGLGASFVTGGKAYNVNPFLPVGHLRQENGFVRNPTGEGWHSTTSVYLTEDGANRQDSSLLSYSNNAFGRSASDSQPHVYYKSSTGIRKVFQWSSWAASLDGNNGAEDPWFALINRRYMATGEGSFNIQSGDFETYISHYAPREDGNDESNYVTLLKDTMDALVNIMGSGSTYGGLTADGCVGVAGTNGWGLPGEQNPMFYYSQLRKQSAPEDSSVTSYWGEYPYGEGTISACGCGPTSFAMAAGTLNNDPTITPDKVAEWAARNGYRSGSEACAGSSWWWIGHPEETASAWGVSSRQISIDEAPELLRQGKLIIASVGIGSPFLSEGGTGHLLVMRGVTSNNSFLFADPSDSRSKRLNGGSGAEGVPVDIFNGDPPGSSHTPVGAAIVSQGLNGLFLIELSGDRSGT